MRKKYKKTYQEVVDEASFLNLSNLGLNAEFAELGPTLGVCKARLRILDLSRNFGITGTLDVVSMCENLEILKLVGCSGLTGMFRKRVYGHNQHVISLADSRNTGSFGKSEPITIA